MAVQKMQVVVQKSRIRTDLRPKIARRIDRRRKRRDCWLGWDNRNADGRPNFWPRNESAGPGTIRHFVMAIISAEVKVRHTPPRNAHDSLDMRQPCEWLPDYRPVRQQCRCSILC